MSKLSLRLRLTLITFVVMIILCGGLTLTSILNAKESFSTFATPVDIMQRVIIPAEKIESATFVPLEEIGEEYATAIMSKITLSYNVSVTQFKWTNIIIMIVAILLSTAIIWFFSGIALKPLKNFSKEIQKVDEKDLSFRVNSPNSKDEISNLSKSFNSMMDKLDQAFSREKRFTDGIVHELNTPLAVIKTNIDVIDEEDMSKEEVFETLTLVKQQTKRMIDLVEQMRNLSRKENLEKETFDLEETVIDVAKGLAEKAKSSQMELTLNSFPTKVYGSKILLKQCVTNLVENAIKYASSGKNVEISLNEDEKSVHLTVSDRGKGISEEDRMKIFEPFYRVDQSRSRLTAGAGLGLSIASEIASLHGGELSCHENKFGGCDFKLILKKSK